MALREYRLPDGSTWQFEEADAPKGAVLVTAEKPAAKRRTAANKAKKAATK